MCCTPHSPGADSFTALMLVLRRLDQLEEVMATAAEQINALNVKVSAQGDVLTDIAADFAAFKEAMEAERENLTPAGQAALDEANANLDANAQRLADLDVAVGDADGSDTPPPPPVEPEPPVA